MPTFQCEQCGRDFFDEYPEEESFVVRSGHRASDPTNTLSLPTCPFCGKKQENGKFSFPI